MRKSCAGFTLVETLISITLLMIFFVALTSIFQIVTNMVGEAKLKTAASQLARQKMEVVHNLPYDSVGTVGGIPAGVLPQTETVEVEGTAYEVAYTILYTDDPFDGLAPIDLISNDYKRVKVSVSWGGAFPSKSPVKLITDVVPNGLETSEGGGTLIINTINSSGVAVSGATVRVINDSVEPNIDLTLSTNSNGQVMIPGAPACTDCYRIEVSRSGYASERTYALSEIANPTKPDATVIISQVTSLSFTIDPTLTLTVRTTGPRASNFPPFTGVQFNLRGTKILGTNTLDQPVYKFDQALATGPGGILTLTNFEPDTYEVRIDNPSSVDLAGTNPISPFSLLPGDNRTLTIVTEPASTHNLLVIVQDLENRPVSTATATITRTGGFIATASAGTSSHGDNGQVLFKSLVPGSYGVKVEQIGYQVATSSATVNSDSKVYLLMERVP